MAGEGQQIPDGRGGEQMTPEQVQEMQEKLSKMSPEELREFQKKNCIFCHIISGKVQSKKIYEDDKVVAILDINPANPGHILVLTKEHYSIMPQIPESTVKYLGIIAKQLSRSVLKTLKVEGTTIFIANGTAAGQRAQHFIMHIIPRAEGDKLGIELKPGNISEKDQMILLDALRKKIVSPAGLNEDDSDKDSQEEDMEEEKDEEERQQRVKELEQEEKEDDSDLDKENVEEDKEDDEVEEAQDDEEDRDEKQSHLEEELGGADEVEIEKPKKVQRAEVKEKPRKKAKKKPVKKEYKISKQNNKESKEKKEKADLNDIADLLAGRI
ncbi:MAG: HIT domain-containing protein [Candidatus Woesearchaeota archaeon]